MPKAAPIKNIGPVSSQWLHAVGIVSSADLKRLGSVKAYRLVQKKGFNATLNLLWALEGALQNKPWRAISSLDKQQLLIKLKFHG
jgi:TfoX/Sxy family transcriptional regulator of competence genes